MQVMQVEVFERVAGVQDFDQFKGQRVAANLWTTDGELLPIGGVFACQTRPL